MRVTIGIASHNVAAIRLRNENNTCERPLGADGFLFLLGITYQDPITYTPSTPKASSSPASCFCSEPSAGAPGAHG